MNTIFDSLTEENRKPVLEDLSSDFDKAEYLQKLLINISTNDGPVYDDHYIKLRRYFIENSTTKQLLPQYVLTNRDPNQFWQFIKHKFPTYAERRRFIWDDFSKLLEYLENPKDLPLTELIEEKLRVFNSEYVIKYWNTAIERKDNDPEGAITISRTLVEGVLKHIADEKKINYSKNADLHEIYKLVAIELNLAPEQHDSKLFKQILGGCSSIVSGLGTLRNRHGDAHGKGKVQYYRPSTRHAELAVNLAGSMSLFLIQTYQENS